MEEYFGNVLMGVINDIRSCMVVISDDGNPVPKQYLHKPNAINHGKRFEASGKKGTNKNHWQNHQLLKRTRSVCGNRASQGRFQRSKNTMAG